MQFQDWKDKVDTFQKIDVRGLSGNFFNGIKGKAQALQEGEGITIVQTFEPHPLYPVMEDMGFVHHCEQKGSTEFHVHFYRSAVQEGNDAPYKPLALLNYPLIDEELGKIAVDFWNLTWNDSKRKLPYEFRLLLSLANAVGAGRMRQASRELVKAYAHGLDSAMLDDTFEQIAWNQGIGFFSSEVGPSELFKAYKLIKRMEKQGKPRAEIVALLKETFGEKNEDVGVM